MTVNGSALKALREAQGWTGRALAREVGISEAFIRALENGTRTGASPGTVKGISQALKVPMAALIREESAA